MTENTMNGQRIVVVGASSGLGRCLGIGFARRGAAVALMARRQQMVDDAAQEAGNGALAIRCDATDQASCESAVAEAADALGGIDAVVYSAGIGELRPIEQLDSAMWHKVFDTNVVGASLVTAAALPHLKSSSGRVIYLTSIAASMTSPWPGLATYAVTKAALDKLTEAWRSEHPAVSFTRVIVGECPGGEGDAASHFTAGWDPDIAMEMYPQWRDRGLLSDKLMDTEHFVDGLAGVLRGGASMSIPIVAFTPRRAI